MKRRLCSNCGIPLFANYQEVGWNHCDSEMNPFGNGCKFDGLFACAGKCLCPTNAEMIGEFEPDTAAPEIPAEQPRQKTFAETFFTFSGCIHSNMRPGCPSCLRGHAARIEKALLAAASPLPARTLSELAEQQGIKPIARKNARRRKQQ